MGPVRGPSSFRPGRTELFRRGYGASGRVVRLDYYQNGEGPAQPLLRIPPDVDAVIHSFHLVDLPARVSARTLIRPPDATTVPGLRHAECLALMRFGAPIVSPARLQLRRFAMFAQWGDRSALDCFLDTHAFGRRLAAGWHVRLQYLRRYGAIAALPDLPERAGSWDPDEPIVAVTIARMKLRELPRFLRWGKPVERLIASHPAAVFSTGAQRPPNTISTFSIWRTVREMTEMVHGRSDVPDPHVHHAAMVEQRRRDFHYESTFMRFRPLSEHGAWQGRQLLPPGPPRRSTSSLA